MTIDEQRARAMLAGLTAKQAEVVEHLGQLRTSKEIARSLGIAPNTVDLRVKGLKEKWGCSNRADLIRLIVVLHETCGQTTCGQPVVDGPPPEMEAAFRDLPDSPEFLLADPQGFGLDEFEKPVTGLEAFDLRFGKLGRVIAIVLLALAMCVGVLVVVNIAMTLSELV